MKKYTINGIDYEVGRIEFVQNLELMKYIKGFTELKLEKGEFDFEAVWSRIVSDGLIGETLSYMIKPVGEKWSERQIEDNDFHKAVQSLYEDEIESIVEEFFTRKKKWSKLFGSFFLNAAVLMKQMDTKSSTSSTKIPRNSKK